MFEWLFGKKDVKRVEDETRKGFESVKKDIDNLNTWVKHLNSESNFQKTEIDSIKNNLSTTEKEIEDLKNMVSVLGNLKPSGSFRPFKRLSNKQTAVEVTQTADQTADQTPNLDHFSVTERAILWVLLNTDMKLSYEDLGTMLGKEKTTIRGQINTIKQKNESLIRETLEKNGKKRVYIPENIQEKLLKKEKVRVKNRK